MENIIRDVRDIETGDRRVLEHVVGQSLRDNQRLVIQVVSLNVSEPVPATSQPATSQLATSQLAAAGSLPEWCNVYEGLSEAEIADLEKSIVRSHETRSLA